VPLDEKRRLATSRRIVVAGTSGPGAGIAAALAAEGARVAVLESASPPHVNGSLQTEAITRVTCDFASAAAVATGVNAAVEALGGIDQFVYAWYPDALTESTTFMEVSEDEWARLCEGALDAAWWLVRSLIGPLRGSGGGSIVFVVPTVGLTGASGFVMLSVVAEGLRVLAKGCGRCWGADGVAVNTLATSPALWVAPDHGERLLREISLSVPAMGRVGDPGSDLAPVIELLGTDEAHFLTAGTLVTDGGLWMGL
jgi:meso-butanediol dehydrogenase / (S,S)-butanediol dehydrogenase / diacetyl reductase